MWSCRPCKCMQGAWTSVVLPVLRAWRRALQEFKILRCASSVSTSFPCLKWGVSPPLPASGHSQGVNWPEMWHPQHNQEVMTPSSTYPLCPSSAVMRPPAKSTSTLSSATLISPCMRQTCSHPNERNALQQIIAHLRAYPWLVSWPCQKLLVASAHTILQRLSPPSQLVSHQPGQNVHAAHNPSLRTSDWLLD